MTKKAQTNREWAVELLANDPNTSLVSFEEDGHLVWLTREGESVPEEDVEIDMEDAMLAELAVTAMVDDSTPEDNSEDAPTDDNAGDAPAAE